MKSYQLIETDFTGKVNHLKEIQNLDVAIILWLIESLKTNGDIKSLPIEIELVYVKYGSEPYPCIGLHYLNGTDNDYSVAIQNRIMEILKYSFINFYNFIENNTLLIQDGIKKLKESK